MFFKKLEEVPAYYWEEKSYMMIIPKTDKDLLKKTIDNLESTKEIKVLDKKTDIAKQTICFKIKYEKCEYEVGMYVGGVSVPDYYLNNLALSAEEKKEILAAKSCLTIYMPFNENPKKCFHLQLKLGLLLVPDLLAVLDESAERVFTRDWVKMEAESKVIPSAKDLFSVQAVSANDGRVWLHTHGLARCGLRELEILDSKGEISRNHYNLINSYAMYLIDRDKDEDYVGGDYIGRLINDIPVVATHVPWIVGLKEYKHLKLGGKKDRKNGHNSLSDIIFLYTSEENEQNNVLSKISIYDDLWGDNPLFFFSDDETKRMKSVAIERFNYVKSEFKKLKDKETILLKIGLPLKEKGKFEHIWFELLEFKGTKFKAKLTQEPYYFPDIHTGFESWYTVDDLTDWIIYKEDMTITPDNVYLLDKKKK